MTDTRKNILVSAYACSPYKGSEPGVGWGFISELCKYHNLHIIVEEEKFKHEITEWLSRNNEADVAKYGKFYFIKKKRNRLLRKIWPPSYYYYYRKWHKDALRLSSNLIYERNIDICHQLTMVGYREPGYLWKLDVPFVWGPVGGAGFFPLRFFASIGMRASLYYALYNFYNYVQMRFSSRVRIAARRADEGLITATSENQYMAMQYWGTQSIQITEVGTIQKKFSFPNPRSNAEPLKLVWSGLIIPRKGLFLALKAISALSENINVELHILGDGPLRCKAEKLANELGIAEKCIFYGWLPRRDCEELLGNMHGSIITSLRDLTSTVIIEALQYSLPVIAPKHCGFVDVLNDNCGVLCDIDDPKTFIHQLADAVTKFYLDESYRMKLSAGASLQGNKFTWAQKIKAANEIYEKKLKKENEAYSAHS